MNNLYLHLWHNVFLFIIQIKLKLFKYNGTKIYINNERYRR
jgi:hypothetical protein